MTYKRNWAVKDPTRPVQKRPRKGVFYDDLIANNIQVKFCNDMYGYKVFQNHKERVIFITRGNTYKYGGCKYCPAVAVNWKDEEGNKKQRLFSLASLVYVYMYHKDVKPGMVVDHIDNDSFNNSLCNLQVLSIRDNSMKDRDPHVNQYSDPSLYKKRASKEEIIEKLERGDYAANTGYNI